MNAWEQARLPRESKRYVTDGNRLKTEGARPVPAWCHDYESQPITPTGSKARIMAAMERMEEVLSK